MMIKLLEEDEAKKQKEILEYQLHNINVDVNGQDLTKSKDYSTQRINWIEENKGWWEAKEETKKMALGQEGFGFATIFVAYPRDTIIGKPQLVYQTKQKITLMKYVSLEKKDGSVFRIVKLFDESFDKRYDGVVQSEWGLDLWVYRIIHDHKEYYVLTPNELPLQVCEIRGMNVEMNDLAEVKKTMKLKSISNVFFAKEFSPTVKIISKKEIVDMTKEVSWKDWRIYLNTHPLGTINQFPEQVDLIRTAQLLSGKIDGWPLHFAVIGLPGTRKSFGYIETTASKFSKDPEIIEGANSRIKGLSPSFKEKPANIGYLAKCERMGWIDELGKMVEQEINKHQSAISNVLGELNFLLDNKKRTVGSGNDNDCVVQATGKFMFATNPVKGMKSLGDHVGLIDPTTMSRILWWVQDKEEINIVMGKEGILRVPPTPTQDIYREREERDESRVSVGGNSIEINDFLTIYDTCNSFLCELDDVLVISVTQNSINIAKEPMKSIWRPRAEHHVRLIIDGICKVRCLFKDHDASFKANDKDYAEASRLISKIVKAWETNLDIKDYSTGVIV